MGRITVSAANTTVDALWAAETALVWIKRKSVTSHVSNQGGGIEWAALTTSTISLEVGTDLVVGKRGLSGAMSPSPEAKRKLEPPVGPGDQQSCLPTREETSHFTSRRHNSWLDMS